MYLATEINLEKKLLELKKKFNLKGIKSEFEAEGSSFNDLARLRNITSRNKIKVYVKIGGVEAINDIYKCIELGIDGIIAPMVETKFGLSKFKESIEKLKLKKKPHLSINIETKDGVKNIDEILNLSKNFLDNITIGRSDLSRSYFNKSLNQDSNFITKIILNIAEKSKRKGLTTTIGGGVNFLTIKNFSKMKNVNIISKIETRKVILPTNSFLKKKNALNSALSFEELYILYKKEINDLMLNSELNRITKLKTRK